MRNGCVKYFTAVALVMSAIAVNAQEKTFSADELLAAKTYIETKMEPKIRDTLDRGIEGSLPTDDA